MTETDMALPGTALTEARRVFGEHGEIHYGANWATAGLSILGNPDDTANEVTVFCDEPLARLLACLRALPEAT